MLRKVLTSARLVEFQGLLFPCTLYLSRHELMHETHHAPHEPIAFRLGTTLLAFVLFLGICLWPGFTGLPPA